MFPFSIVKRNFVVKLLTVFLAVQCGIPTLAAEDSSGPLPAGAPEYKVHLERSIMVEMRDGVRLSTDLYMPEGATGKLPTILIRMPYGKYIMQRSRDGDWATVAFGWHFAGQGYAVAVQDKRGRYESGGEYFVGADDVLDSYDTIEWITSQDWSSGKVGTYGCSYLGEIQVRQASKPHPKLLAMVPQAGSGGLGAAGNWYHYFATFTGGTVGMLGSASWFANYGSKVFYRPPERLDREDFLKSVDLFEPAPKPVDLDHATIWDTLPISDITDVAGAPPNDWREFISRDLADPWWDQFGYLNGTEPISTPALHTDSWADYGAAQTLYQFQMFRDNAINKKFKDAQFAVIDAMPHCSFARAAVNSVVGEREIGDARFDYWGLYLKWFDYWLKGKKNGLMEMPKLQYYLLGKNEWRSAESWPLPNTQFTKFYLGSQEGANSLYGDGFLSTDVPIAEESYDSYTYDPMLAVPSKGGPVCCTKGKVPGGFVDQRSIEIRNDILVFTTEPLQKGIEVTGPIEMVLYVSSTAQDTDFTGKLVDVFPDGRALNVQDGILRARYREGYDKKVWMEPDRIYRVPVRLHATGTYFPEGHRIRLEVSSSNFPMYDRNLNTGGNNYDESKSVKADIKIYHDKDHPSHLILPIIPEAQ